MGSRLKTGTAPATVTGDELPLEELPNGLEEAVDEGDDSDDTPPEVEDES